jgi:hypothetical protein
MALKPSQMTWLEKGIMGLSLLFISGLLYLLDFYILGKWEHIREHFLLKLAFLPIHALVLGMIIEESLAFRDSLARRKKLNMFLGVFFRQMGVDIYVHMAALVNNRDALEKIITVHPQWKRRQFKEARQRLGAFKLEMNQDPKAIRRVFNLLMDKEKDIIDLTRNTNLWEYENLYRVLLALFHLIEETRFRGEIDALPEGALRHLSDDIGNSLLLLLELWLGYLEFLKGEHPVLFGFQMGVHNTVHPVGLDRDLGN